MQRRLITFRPLPMLAIVATVVMFAAALPFYAERFSVGCLGGIPVFFGPQTTEVTITRSGYTINREPVRERHFADRLKAVRRDSSEAQLHVHTDHKLPPGETARIIAIARNAGFDPANIHIDP